MPVRSGGLGVRRIQDIALPAFLSSVNGLSSLVSYMLQIPTLHISEIADYQDGLNAWNELNPDANEPEKPALQKQWDLINVNRMLNELQFDDEDEDKA